jgi:hypothetical protein
MAHDEAAIAGAGNHASKQIAERSRISKVACATKAPIGRDIPAPRKFRKRPRQAGKIHRFQGCRTLPHGCTDGLGRIPHISANPGCHPHNGLAQNRQKMDVLMAIDVIRKPAECVAEFSDLLLDRCNHLGNGRRVEKGLCSNKGQGTLLRHREVQPDIRGAKKRLQQRPVRRELRIHHHAACSRKPA